MGAPIAPKPIDPVLTYSSSVMLVRDPPHPHAALLFIDFLLSKQGQGVLREAQMFPADPEVGASPKLDAVLPAKLGLRENFLPPEKMQRELKKSQEIFVKLFNP
jgi:iron(III) transport system substrate-binding protein